MLLNILLFLTYSTVSLQAVKSQRVSGDSTTLSKEV
jgi:hypothetical protein